MSIVSGSSSTSSGGNLTLASGDGNSASVGDSNALDVGSSGTNMGGTTGVIAGNPLVFESSQKKSKSVPISIDSGTTKMYNLRCLLLISRGQIPWLV